MNIMRGFAILSVFFILGAAGADAAPALAEPVEQSPRLLVHLLDYLAKDYGGAVAHGKVISQSEYKEQLEFSASTLETNAALAETKGTPEIQTKLQQLSRLIGSKAEAVAVAKLAREIQAQLIKLTGLEISPSKWPSLARGKQLFEQNCISCHGATGHGDGPAAAALSPKPANFHDETRMKELSPFQAFNTVRLGVPGTSMAPFHNLSDKEAWFLAFYVVSLRHAVKPVTGADIDVSAGNLKIVATTSDEKLKFLLPGDDQQQSLALAALRLHSEDDDSGNSLAIARGNLQGAEVEYHAGRFDSAKTKALKAYLEGIEPIEPRLKANDPGAVIELETRMGLVRSLIEGRKPLPELHVAIQAAIKQIDAAEQIITHQEMSPLLSFMAAGAILLREGFEAVFIIIALLGVIRASGSRRAALWVQAGWIAALGCGGLAWIFSGWLMGISGAQREMMEAVTSLFAVVVLLYVGFWLHSRTEIGRWKSFIDGKLKAALEGRNLWGLAAISFMAVFREAFETVLFLRAVWLEGGESSRAAMAAGVFTSLAFVLIFAWAILKYSARLPIRKIFAISALLMAVMAMVLTGKGLHSLQESGALSITAAPFQFRSDIFGLYPTFETVFSQVLVLGLLAALWIYGKRPSTGGSTLRIS